MVESASEATLSVLLQHSHVHVLLSAGVLIDRFKAHLPEID